MKRTRAEEAKQKKKEEEEKARKKAAEEVNGSSSSNHLINGCLPDVRLHHIYLSLDPCSRLMLAYTCKLLHAEIKEVGLAVTPEYNKLLKKKKLTWSKLLGGYARHRTRHLVPWPLPSDRLYSDVGSMVFFTQACKCNNTDMIDNGLRIWHIGYRLAALFEFALAARNVASLKYLIQCLQQGDYAFPTDMQLSDVFKCLFQVQFHGMGPAKKGKALDPTLAVELLDPLLLSGIPNIGYYYRTESLIINALLNVDIRYVHLPAVNRIVNSFCGLCDASVDYVLPDSILRRVQQKLDPDGVICVAWLAWYIQRVSSQSNLDAPLEFLQGPLDAEKLLLENSLDLPGLLWVFTQAPISIRPVLTRPSLCRICRRLPMATVQFILNTLLPGPPTPGIETQACEKQLSTDSFLDCCCRNDNGIGLLRLLHENGYPLSIVRLKKSFCVWPSLEKYMFLTQDLGLVLTSADLVDLNYTRDASHALCLNWLIPYAREQHWTSEEILGLFGAAAKQWYRDNQTTSAVATRVRDSSSESDSDSD